MAPGCCRSGQSRPGPPLLNPSFTRLLPSTGLMEVHTNHQASSAACSLFWGGAIIPILRTEN